MKTQSKRTLMIGGSLIGVAILATLLWVFVLHKEKPPQLMSEPVAYGNVEKTVLASGTLEPFRQVSVGAQVSGQVVTLAVELGDQVKQGDLIAEIDSASQKNNLLT